MKIFKGVKGAMTTGATALVVFTILMIGVVLPIVQDLTGDLTGNTTTYGGITLTILSYLPVFIVLIVLVVYARMADA